MANKKQLREFVENNLRTLDYIKTHLESVFGTFYRLGGEYRVYTIDGTNQKAAIFAIGNTMQACALAWTDGPNKVNSIYWWNDFSFNKVPDYAVDLPTNGNFSSMLVTVEQMIKNHTMGEVEIDA